MNSMQFEFDAVVAHLYKQRRPAKGVDGFCKYRGENGTTCAVGCRIPDSMYDEEMDKPTCGGQLHSLMGNNFPLPVEITTYEGMFGALQDAHDSCSLMALSGKFDMDDLSCRLQDVANDYCLTFKEPKL